MKTVRNVIHGGLREAWSPRRGGVFNQVRKAPRLSCVWEGGSGGFASACLPTGIGFGIDFYMKEEERLSFSPFSRKEVMLSPAFHLPLFSSS